MRLVKMQTMLHLAQIARQADSPVRCATLGLVTPKEQYAQRLSECEARVVRLDRDHARIGGVRLGLGASFVIMAVLSWNRSLSPAWLLLPIASFIGVLLYHVRVQDRRVRAARAVRHCQAALARMDDRWSGTGPTGAHFANHHHIYSADIDIFGDGGLYQLLCAARTQMGEETLAGWLLAPADAAAIENRQECIRDLRDRFEFREEMALCGNSLQIELHPERLTQWAESPNLLDAKWIRWSALPLAAMAVAGVIAWAWSGVVFPLLLVVGFEGSVFGLVKARVKSAISAVEDAYEDLKGLSELMNRIESAPFEASALRALVGELSTHSMSASRALSKLATVVNFVEARRNPLLAPLLIMLMYPLLTALAAERWRAAHGRAIRAWLGVLGRFEALLSLARYSHEHPADPFPEFLTGSAAFTASSLGHPLIPALAMVRNDVDISGATRVWLVSGSNMSGKSTLLRTIGINTVLAMAGAPVRAARLQLTPLQVGAAIRVNDSLHEGSSRFYAEITRLRQLFEAYELPLLFLLDELLQGTNSADRRVGAEGVIRALLKRGAIGLVSTHDLALTHISDLPADALVNVHFQDEILDGRLKFDFKLHPGIITKSNGVQLMRSIGLEV